MYIKCQQPNAPRLGDRMICSSEPIPRLKETTGSVSVALYTTLKRVYSIYVSGPIHHLKVSTGCTLAVLYSN